MTGSRPHVTIVTGEARSRLGPLLQALRTRGVRCRIAPATAVHLCEPTDVLYLRELDPRLEEHEALIRMGTVAAPGVVMVNSPASVRLAECVPLTALALREQGLRQPSRAWCFEEEDVQRASHAFGLPLTVEGVASHVRVTVRSSDRLGAAVDRARGPDRRHGMLVEHPPDGMPALAEVLVVGGEAVATRIGTGGGSGAALASCRALARAAVAAVGGAVMSVEISLDADGAPCVRRLEPAFDLADLDATAVAAVADAVMPLPPRDRSNGSRPRSAAGGRQPELVAATGAGGRRSP